MGSVSANFMSSSITAYFFHKKKGIEEGYRKIYNSNVGFQTQTAVIMKISVFWDITLCSTSKFSRRFRG
jgi:hypothetical protein